MILDPKQLDRLYAKLESFGPQLRISIADRLKAELPNFSDSDRDEIHQTLKSIGTTVWALAEQGGEAKMKRDEIASELQKEHPFLQDKGLKQALFLVNYYAWHEGYDK